jgi:flagellar protein FlaG
MRTETGRQQSAEIRQQPTAAERVETSARPRAREALAVVDLKTEIQRVSREIDLHVDPESDDVVVRVVDRETGELVRQIPSEELLELARNLHELREQAVSEDIPVADAVGEASTHAKEGLLIHTKA